LDGYRAFYKEGSGVIICSLQARNGQLFMKGRNVSYEIYEKGKTSKQ
jgi:hypothetical protein